MKKRCRESKCHLQQPKTLIGIIKIFQMPGFVKLIYSFVMKNNYNCKLNQRLFFNLRHVCKESRILANDLVTFLDPTIGSLHDLNFWTSHVPNLRSISDIPFFWSISFPNLRDLSFQFNEQPQNLNVIDVYYWNCPLLKSLYIKAITSQSVVHAIAKQFVNLTSLYAFISSCNSYLGIFNFFKLETLNLKLLNNMTEVQISSLPNLKNCIIRKSNIKSLIFQHDLSNLTNLQLKGNIENVIFHYPIALQTISCLGSYVINFDPHDNVKWENIQTCQFIYSDCWAKNLVKLKSVVKLSIVGPPADFFNLISCLQNTLQDIDINWSKDDYILDFQLLVGFVNIEKIHLFSTNGKYTHFEDVFQIPKLQVFTFYIDNLLEAERKLYRNWRDKQREKKS